MIKSLMASIGLLASASVMAATIKLAAVEWEPYAGLRLPNAGFTTEIIKEAFKRVGHDMTVNFMPWARVLIEVEKGIYDGMFPAYFSEERTKFAVFSEPFGYGSIVFMKQKSAKIDWKTLEDLKGYTIGIVRGYVNTKEFDGSTILNKIVANNDEENLRKLCAKKIDLVVIDSFVVKNLLEKKYPSCQETVESLAQPLDKKPLYLAISKNTPDYEKKINDFNVGLKQLINEGVVDKIIQKEGLK